MISTLFETSFLTSQGSLFLALGCGFTILLTLNFCGHYWSRTLHSTLTILMLPAIVAMVTDVIAGNIALSLGMVGALSIVRFRNPVRSSFELTTYFALIAIGIGINTDAGAALALTFTFILVLSLSYVVQRTEISKKRSVFPTSFSEGNPGANVEVSSVSSNIEKYIDNGKVLQFSSGTEVDARRTYTIYFRNYELARNFIDKLENNGEKIQFTITSNM